MEGELESQAKFACYTVGYHEAMYFCREDIGRCCPPSKLHLLEVCDEVVRSSQVVCEDLVGSLLVPTDLQVDRVFFVVFQLVVYLEPVPVGL